MAAAARTTRPPRTTVTTTDASNTTATTATRPPSARVQPLTTDASLSGVFSMPQKASKRGSATLYPFKSLTAVGMSFGVMNKTVKELASVLSNQNSKIVEKRDPVTGIPVFKTIKNPDGSDMIDPITGNVLHSTEIEMTPGPQFFAHEVDVNAYPEDTPPEQRAPVRVFRHS